MTVRPEKSTRLPDRLPRKRPCLPFRRWQNPRIVFFGCSQHNMEYDTILTFSVSLNFKWIFSNNCQAKKNDKPEKNAHPCPRPRGSLQYNGRFHVGSFLNYAIFIGCWKLTINEIVRKLRHFRWLLKINNQLNWRNLGKILHGMDPTVIMQRPAGGESTCDVRGPSCTCMCRGMPDVSLLYSSATCSCRKSQSSCKPQLTLSLSHSMLTGDHPLFDWLINCVIRNHF